MTASMTQKTPEPVSTQAPERTRSERCYTPPTDIYETADAIILVADMPGVGAEGVAVELEGGTLTLSGTPTVAAPEGEALRREYQPGGYQRAFSVSDAIERKRIQARIKDGVLTVVLPKAAPAKAHKIPVQGG